MARQIRSGVAGISKWRIPSGANASLIAFMTAGNAPTVPASPAPLTPSGLFFVGILVATDRERRQIHRTWHAVVHERTA